MWKCMRVVHEWTLSLWNLEPTRSYIMLLGEPSNNARRREWMYALYIFARPLIIYQEKLFLQRVCTKKSSYHDVGCICIIWASVGTSWMSKGAFRGTASTIGVKQGRLFSLPSSDSTSMRLQTTSFVKVVRELKSVHILIYADDLDLVAESHAGLQHHLNVLGGFCHKKRLKINLGKTKTMIFYCLCQLTNKLSLPIKSASLWSDGVPT